MEIKKHTKNWRTKAGGILFCAMRNLSVRLYISAFIAGALLLAGSWTWLYAATTTPLTINYQGRLLNSSNIPLSGNYTFRFSFWNTADWVAGDTTGGGAINAGSAGYAGWQEVHSVATDAFGLFNMNLGDTTTFPSFNANTHKFMQVEVKITGNPDTSYEILDPAGTLADTNDRKPLQNQAFAQNSDTIDNAEIGLLNGNIALLGPGNVFPASTIPGATNANSFTLDNDNNAGGPVALQFGALLAKILSYIPASSWFNFNDNVNIQGNLTTTGTINGVNLSSIPFANLTTRTKKAVFKPDYDGATLRPDGTNNKGKIVENYEDLGGAAKRNFYEWRTQQVVMQDIDIIISFRLPLDFVSFTGAPLSLDYRMSDGVIANNRLDVAFYDTTGAAVVLTGGSALANGSWTTTNITFGGGETFTAGDTVTLILRLSSTNAGFVRVSDVVLNYNGR